MLIGTQNVLDSCISNNITKLITTSSSAVYKNSDDIVSELSDAEPSSPVRTKQIGHGANYRIFWNQLFNFEII